jgi:hypothetical protein
MDNNNFQNNQEITVFHTTSVSSGFKAGFGFTLGVLAVSVLLSIIFMLIFVFYMLINGY